MARVDWEYYEEMMDESSPDKVVKSKKPKKTWKQVNEQKQKKVHKKKWKNKRRSGYDKHHKDK